MRFTIVFSCYFYEKIVYIIVIEFADRLMRHVWKKLGSKIEHDIHSYVDEHIQKILFLHLE